LTFNKRYEILLEGKLVSPESIRITAEIIGLIEHQYHVKLVESNGASIVTHLAVTLKKILSNEHLTDIPEVCLAEALSYKAEMDFARVLVQRLHEFHQIELNLSETAFLAVHLKNICRLMEKEVEKK